VEPRVLGALDLTTAAWPTKLAPYVSPVYTIPDMLPQAVYFVEVFTTCSATSATGAAVTGVCQFGSMVDAHFLQVKAGEQVTGELKTGVIILSIAGPAFLAFYFLYDHLMLKKAQKAAAAGEQY